MPIFKIVPRTKMIKLVRNFPRKDEISTRKLRFSNLKLVREKGQSSNMRIPKKVSTIHLKIRMHNLKSTKLNMLLIRIHFLPRSKSLRRSMIPLWMTQLNKRLILKEIRLLKIRNSSSWNKETKSTRINKLRPSRDTKRDSSKRRKKPTKPWVTESPECSKKKKAPIPNTNKRERHSKS